MKMIQLCTGLVLLWMGARVTAAGEVEVTGVHLCCGQCVTAVGNTLKDVEGVSGAACDREEKTVTFTAANEEAAQAGIDALAEAGFHGSAKHGDDELEFPESGAKEDAKANEITLSGLHLCCGACVRAVDAVVNEVDGVNTGTCDREKRTCSVTGENISVEALIKALNDAGFHAKIEEE